MTTAAGEAEALHCMSSNKDQRLRLLMSQELRKKAEQAQLSQSFFRGEMLQSPHHLCSPPLDSLQERHVSLVLGSPELDTVLEESIPVTALKPSQTSEQKIGNSYYRLRQALPMQLYLRQRKTSTHKWLDNHTEFVSQKSSNYCR
ncbi:uncharacterized protein [Struthio camelus]|uniref:uncharacterized protein isoform X6 n=1 Tax=Struthio camelus TaxID=8801 RepID=UPI0036040AE6